MHSTVTPVYALNKKTRRFQEQLQHRLTLFQDAWPKLHKWFNKYGSLVAIDASQHLESVYLEVEKILEDTLQKVKAHN